MRHLITFLLAVTTTLSGLGVPASARADDNIQLTTEMEFDFSVAPFELWNGTQLQPMELPEVRLHETTIAPTDQPQPVDNHKTEIAKPLQFKSSMQNETDAKLTTQQHNELAFAEPLDFQVWNLVKWTVVVILIAGAATYIFRFKHTQNSPQKSGRTLILCETLTIDPRTKVHLIEMDGERYLIASDLNGIKSITLVPNWNAGPNMDLSLTDESATSPLAKAS